MGIRAVLLAFSVAVVAVGVGSGVCVWLFERSPRYLFVSTLNEVDILTPDLIAEQILTQLPSDVR